MFGMTSKFFKQTTKIGVSAIGVECWCQRSSDWTVGIAKQNGGFVTTAGAMSLVTKPLTLVARMVSLTTRPLASVVAIMASIGY